jgi:hypothetical protein
LPGKDKEQCKTALFVFQKDNKIGELKKQTTEGGKSEVTEGQGDQGSKRVRPGVYDVHEDRTSEADAEIRSQSGTAARTRKLKLERRW